MFVPLCLSDFVTVLRCFVVVLSRLREDLWKDEGEEYPQVVFDAVKDNSAFIGLLEESDPTGKDTWFFDWFDPFLESLQRKASFPDVVAKMVGFMCEELQHERFINRHGVILASMCRVCVVLTSIGALP